MKIFSFLDKPISLICSVTNFINKHWVIGFLLLVIYFSYISFGNLINNSISWNYIHLQIFTLTFLVLLLSLINVKINMLLIFLIFITNEIFVFDEFFEPVANFFYQSPCFDFITKSIAVKDLNVFFLISFIAIFILFLFKLIINKLQDKYWNIYNIFSLLFIGSIIFITFIFHYILIEHQFKPQIEEKLSQQETILSLSNNEDFLKICNINKYNCYSKNSIQEILKDIPELQNSLSYLDSSKYIKGNFLINPNNNQIYLITAYQDKWVIDIHRGSSIFKNNENLLLLGLSFAHGFWLLFYLWLNLFHRSLKNKRKINNSHSKC